MVFESVLESVYCIVGRFAEDSSRNAIRVALVASALVVLQQEVRAGKGSVVHDEDACAQHWIRTPPDSHTAVKYFLNGV